MNQILLLVLGGFILSIVTGPIVYIFGDLSTAGPLRGEKLTLGPILLAVVIVPILETLLHQYFIYEILIRYPFFKNRKYLIFLISAILFGLLHFYSLAYIVWAFFMGIYFIICFDFFRYSNRNAYWLTCLLHGIRNSIALLIDTMF